MQSILFIALLTSFLSFSVSSVNTDVGFIMFIFIFFPELVLAYYNFLEKMRYRDFSSLTWHPTLTKRVGCSLFSYSLTAS